MKATIKVEDRKEADGIRAGLSDPSIRAFVIVMGALNSLCARKRVLNFVTDHLVEVGAKEPRDATTLRLSKQNTTGANG